MRGHYHGDLGMWMFLLHRFTGVGIFAFLLVHILDTSLMGFSPRAYDHMVWLYHHPAFRIGEIVLFGAVLFHALNGVRVVLMDFVPALTVYNHQLIVGVVGGFAVLFVPSAAVMFHYMLQGGGETVGGGGWGYWRAWLPAATSALVVAAVGAPSLRLPHPHPPARPAGGAEFLGWAFMRVSGILLLFLVLGHFAIMHLLDGGVNRVNAAFVTARWAGVGWRIYDFLMLVLAMGHGVWGMRTVLLDFVHRPIYRFWALAFLYTLSGILVAVGALVLFTFQVPAR